MNLTESAFNEKRESEERSGDATRRGGDFASSRSSDELGAGASLEVDGAARRATSLVDVLLRRKRALNVTCHVIENPMHAALDDDADTAAHDAHATALPGPANRPQVQHQVERLNR